MIDENAIYKNTPICFAVTNINPFGKTIKIHDFNIKFGQTLDLMKQIGMTENIIKVSLLKGELKYKLMHGDIVIECSDVNLVVYNTEVQIYLTAAGINTGVIPDMAALPFALRYNVPLIGDMNGQNQIFMTPDYFVYGNLGLHYFRPQVFHNGALKLGGIIHDPAIINGMKAGNIDYIVEKSSIAIPGNLYDVIRFISFVPNSHSRLVATYAAGAL